MATVTVAAVLFGAGCEADEEPIPDLGPTSAELGAGEDDYTYLEEDDEVQIVLGPQGGHMIALGVRAQGIWAGDPDDPTDGKNPRTTFQAFLAGEEQPLGSITVARGLSSANEDLELLGTWLIFNSAHDTAVYFDKSLDITVSIVDTYGNTAEADVTIMAIAPEEEPDEEDTSTAWLLSPAAPLLDFDIEPGVVVGRVDDDSELSARDVRHAHDKPVAVVRGDGRVSGVETFLVGHVALQPIFGVVHGEQGDEGDAAHYRMEMMISTALDF